MKCLLNILGTIVSLDNFWPQTHIAGLASVHLQSSEIQILNNHHSTCNQRNFAFFQLKSIQILIVEYFPKTHFCHSSFLLRNLSMNWVACKCGSADRFSATPRINLRFIFTAVQHGSVPRHGVWESLIYMFSNNVDLKTNSRNSRKPFWTLCVRE